MKVLIPHGESRRKGSHSKVQSNCRMLRGHLERTLYRWMSFAVVYTFSSGFQGDFWRCCTCNGDLISISIFGKIDFNFATNKSIHELTSRYILLKPSSKKTVLWLAEIYLLQFSSILISFALTENVGRMPANCILIDPPFYSENELVTSVVYRR